MLTHTHKGRTWQEAGREPYTRVDGSTTELIRWQAPCAKCDVAFEIKTPCTNYQASSGFELVHCPEHRLTNAQISARATAARRTARGKK